jgi:hypothetical protein
VKCNTPIMYRNGILGGNFFAPQCNWTPYHKAWCASCFKPLEGDIFPTMLTNDEDGNVLVNEEDVEWFCVATPGVHLFCPFQCELCHFRNIQGRSPMYGTVVLDDS